MQSRPRQLIHTVVLGVLLSCAALAAQAEPVLKIATNLIWERDEVWFGGFSGMEIGANGDEITLLTDRRNLVPGRMLRKNGRLVGLTLQKRVPIRHANRQLVGGRFADTEGLAIAADGTTYISFENATRVVRVSPETGVTHRLPDHPDFARMKRNKGLEALAVHPSGAIYTLPERVPPHRKTIPLYAFAQGKWRLAHQLPRRGPFMSVGADFDRKGRFYLLERALSPLGFRSRIRRFDLNGPNLGEVTLLSSNVGRFDNMEALSIWEDAAGDIHLTMISDDNFRSIQRTQIVEFTLTE